MNVPRANPFVGLRPFESDEAMLFFGRDEQTIELLERLQASRFLAVVGSSGCGKSSLVRAGLVSKLKAGMLSQSRDRWLVATMKPGARPFDELAAVLAGTLPATTLPGTGDASFAELPSFAETLRTGGLTPLLEQLAPVFERGDTSLLLVVDQFEELFRFGLRSDDEASREEASEFVALVLGLARQDAFPIYVVTTMRSDFLGDCDAFRGLPEAMNQSQYLVPRLPRGKRQEAVEGPARLYGKRIAPRLVNRLLNDGGAADDQLPVLQHALMRLWEAAGDAEELDMAHYKAVGGLAALSKHAGEALVDLGSGELEVAEKVFRTLTTTEKNRRIRRPRTVAHLVAETGEARARIVRVIDAFRGHGRSFLTPPEGVELRDDTLVDISHESLIRQWRTLRDWVKAEAEVGYFYRRLAEGARLYRTGEGSLLVDQGLEAAREWRRKTEPTDAWAKRYGGGFGDAMDFLAESHRRDRRRVVVVRAVQGTLVALFLLVAALAIFSAWQWREARQKTLDADYNLAQVFEEKAGVALAKGTLEGTREAWLCSLAALSEVRDRWLPASAGRLLKPDLRASIFREVWRSPRPPGQVLSVAFSPDGKQIASGSDDQTIRLWYSYHLEELADAASRRIVFEKLFRASLDCMRFRRVDLRFEPTPDRPSFIPLNGYTFPQARRPPHPLERPRPPGKDPLEWLLENPE
ncbi:MAG: hypothetical protein GY856_14730 [bacterium]|nr:hypothetical protein [bacterium]